MLSNFINIVFRVYEILIIVRIFLSWIPHNPHNAVFRFIYETTDPYLNLFRRFIPPISMIDISPIVAIFVLHLIQQLVFYILGGLLI